MVEIHALNEGIKVYPNPVQNSFKIDYRGHEIETLTLYNSQGQLIKELRIESEGITETNISHLPSGVYILRINHTMMRRIVKL